MKTETEIRRAFNLMGALIALNNGAEEQMPESDVKLVKHTHTALAWVQGRDESFGKFLEALESTLAANDVQIVEVDGRVCLARLRENHRKRTPIRKR